MAKNNGKQWTPQQVVQLRSLVKGTTPTRVIGLKMGRTPVAIQAKASALNVSLKPNNRSPYGTKKK